MKSQLQTLLALGALLAVALAAFPLSSSGQGGAVTDDPALSRLLAEVSAQQTQIANNQAQIDEKIAQIGEEVRQARLFVARGGGAR